MKPHQKVAGVYAPPARARLAAAFMFAIWIAAPGVGLLFALDLLLYLLGWWPYG